jgi:hypothetical protein
VICFDFDVIIEIGSDKMPFKSSSTMLIEEPFQVLDMLTAGISSIVFDKENS